MPKINLLSPEVAQLIAAGEVVERPGSVVKEMVENSIDAHATAVTVEIKNGGNTFIRISDNGCGIAREDCPAAFMPHATSKISCGDDLDSIATLGFRGEALASVASVAKVEMLTKTREEEIGTRIEIHGGDIIDLDDAGCPDGTVITVRELFFNTPARKKFLKKDMTEGANIAGIMDRLALSHPEISFTLRNERGDVLYTPGDGRLMSAVSAVLGRETAEGMTELEYTFDKVGIKGCVCRPVNSRPNRNMQIFFLNGRFIRSKTFTAALEQAYKDSIMVGKFPSCVLNITMPFDLADVNVHPAKMEVRFADEQTMFRAVYYAVKTALEGESVTTQKAVDNSVLTRPAEFKDEKAVQPSLWENKKGGFYNIDLTKKAQPVTYPAQNEKTEYTFLRSEPVITVRVPESYNVSAVNAEPEEPVILKTENEAEKPVVSKTEYEPEEMRPDLIYVGEVFDTYIIAQCGDSVFFVDKHALHERVLFEKLKKGTEVFSQPLLTPISVTLSKEEYIAVLENADTLKKAGFDVSDFGDGTVLLRSMPMYYENEDAVSSITEIAGKLINDKMNVTTDRIDWLFRSVACRAAIKAGARSSKEELMKMLTQIDDIRYCPHGRPVTLELTKNKLEKEFHRQ